MSKERAKNIAAHKFTALKKTNNQYAVYRAAINQMARDDDHLPSLPKLTVEIRKEIANPDTTTEQLAYLINRDPGLRALLMKTCASPIYQTVTPSLNLHDAISRLGMSVVSNLVMLHSIKTMFVIESPLRPLFNSTWRRMSIKTSLAAFFSKKYKHLGVNAENAILASLLTEVGSLSILSALREFNPAPDKQAYVSLCKQYSKSLGLLLMNKWEIDKDLIEAVKRVGHWNFTSGDKLELIDILNLSLYNTVLHYSKNHTLPLIVDIKSYQKLRPPYNFIHPGKPNTLQVVFDGAEEIRNLVQTFY